MSRRPLTKLARRAASALISEPCASFLEGERDRWVGKSSRRGTDGGERRAQVMGHGVQEGRLQLLATSGNLKLGGLLLETVAHDSLPDLVRCGG